MSAAEGAAIGRTPAGALDPAYTARNRGRYPVDDPPICERRGCGHYWGLHWNSETKKHGICRCGCGCTSPVEAPR